MLPGDGPLIVTADDEEKIAQLLGLWATPGYRNYTPEVAGVHAVDAFQGASPQTGARVRAYDFLLDRMSFFGDDPIGGEPDPISRVDGAGYQFASYGWRVPLRGYVGSMSRGSLNMEIRAEWADAAVRASSDPRGAWTGMYMASVFGIDLLRSMTLMHGKRSHEADWIYHGTFGQGEGSWPPSDVQTVPWNGVDSGKVRFVISGGSPSWQILCQYWDGSAWQTLNTNNHDFLSDLPPGFESYIAFIPYLFSGPTALNTGPVPPVPILTSYFDQISASQFEPFVLDTAEWSFRDRIKQYEWISGPWWGDHIGIEPLLVPMGSTDLGHFPSGSGREPTELRTFDQDLGWCVRFGPSSILVGRGQGEFLGIEAGIKGNHPLVTADTKAYGPAAPFSMVHRYKFENMASWSTRRGLIDFGKTTQEAPFPLPGESGIGFFWEPASGPNPNRLVARIWNTGDGSGVWTELSFQFEPEDWDGRPVDIGIAWTGARGVESGGRPNYEFRLLVNGRTVDSVVLGDAIEISSSARVAIGASPQAGFFTFTDSFEGLWAGGMCFSDAMSDYQLEKSWERHSLPFVNDSFETEATDGRPGEAYDWDWQNVQQVGGWADFNSYDMDLDPWYRALESFEAGWDDNQLWIDTFDSLALISALFNAMSGPYRTTVETFDLWSFPDITPLPPASYTGPPWRTDFQEWRTDDADQPGGAVGFSSWYDHLAAVLTFPLGVESFDEAWGNDPFSTGTGPLWQPGTASTARLYGRWIDPPMIAAGQNRMLLYRGLTDEVAELTLTAAASYTAASLQVELDTALSAALPGPHALSFEVEEDSTTGKLRVSFGWDRATIASESFMFMALKREFYNDARPSLGLDLVGTDGKMNGVDYAASLISALPLGFSSDDVFVADCWSFSSFSIANDPATGMWFPLVYDQAGAIFDTTIGVNTYLEQFLLAGWFGAGAVWKPAYFGPDLTPVTFDFGTIDQDTIETFIAAQWPDEIWT